MFSKSLGWTFISLLLCLPMWSAQSQDASSLLNSCWSPSLLIEKKNETKFIHGVHSFDTPTPTSEDFISTLLPSNFQGPIRRVRLHTDRKLIALTFDLCEVLGEVAGYDGALVDYLRKSNIKATFFAGGKWMRSHSERAQQLMVDPLFEVANHSEAHRNLRLLKNQSLKNEILGPHYTYRALRASLEGKQCVQDKNLQIVPLPQRMNLFRFPFGACNDVSITAVNDAGFLIIQWDLSLGDPVREQSAEAIARILLKAKPGSIVIGHANGHGYHTAEALKIALPQLLDKGFEFVTVSELLREGSPEIAPSCYNVRPGDTDKYDSFFIKKRSIHPTQ